MKHKTKFFNFKNVQYLVCSILVFNFLFAGNKNAFASSSNLGFLLESGQSEKKLISGTVTDTNGQSLPGVTVVIKGTTVGSVTNENGYYQLSIPVNVNFLVFSFVGMESQEIVIGGQSTINVVMVEKAIALGELVAIGYGKQSRELLTMSVSKIDTLAFENVPYSNVAYVLQGTSGVRVTSTSGQPGASPLIVIRGGTSLDPNSSYPLYVIDGVISPDMSGLNNNDIESIEILKDAASTAIYGARGSNGVVLISTKGGKSGRTKINYSYNLTLSNYESRLEMMSARDFIYYQRLGIVQAARKWPFFESILHNASSAGTGNDLSKHTFYTTQYLTPENQHKLHEGWESMPDPIDESKTIIFKNTDWRDVIFRTSVSNNHNISASGGTDRSNYSVSLGYLDVNGVAIGTGFNRLSLNTKGEAKVLENLSVTGNVRYSSGKTTGVSSESLIFGRMLQVAPTAKYKFEDGTLAHGDRGNKGNPEYRLNITPSGGLSELSTFTLGAQWGILPNLSFNPQASILTRQNRNWSFVKANYDANNYDDTRSASESRQTYYAKQLDGVLTYNESLNNIHNLSVTAGFSFLETEENNLSGSARGAATDHIYTLNASAIPVGVSSAQAFYRYMGYFSRFDYNYKNKYLATLNARYDGASNLGSSHKWGFFPGISGGWNLHSEDFWEFIKPVVSKLKLRASYGVNGNTNAIGPYQSQGSYSVGQKYNGIGAVVNTVLENPDLKWETATTFNIGMDLGLIGNKINFIFDIYRKVTDNLLSGRTLPHETGFSNIITNLGSIENKGLDLEVNFKPLSNNSLFKWDISLNGSYVEHKILKLPPNGIENNRIGGIYIWDDELKDYAWKGGLQEGGKMGELYAYRPIGLFHSDEDAQNSKPDILIEGDDKITKYGGDTKWDDRDGNGIIDQKDRVYAGSIYPKWTGGATNTFSYKNFYFTCRVDFALGHTIYNYMRATTTGQFAGDLGLSIDAARSWLKPGDEEYTDIPRLYYGDWQANLNRGSTIMHEKGDYLAIRELTLSYQISSQLLQKIKISNLRFNLTGQNLHYFTNYKGINPEFGGTDNGSYPISASYILGASITF